MLTFDIGLNVIPIFTPCAGGDGITVRFESLDLDGGLKILSLPPGNEIAFERVANPGSEDLSSGLVYLGESNHQWDVSIETNRVLLTLLARAS